MAVSGLDPNEFVKKRISTAFVFILTCYLSLVARLVYLQTLHGNQIRAEATSLRRKEITLRARTGTILDRSGRPLAVSLYFGVAGFDPKTMQVDPGNDESATKIQAKLAKSIACTANTLHLPASEVAEKVRLAMTDYPHSHRRFYPIKSGLTWDQAARFRANAIDMPGFGVADTSQRVYACGRSAAQVIGFMGSNPDLAPLNVPGLKTAQASDLPRRVGLDGLERGCSNWLSAVNGKKTTEVDDNFHEIPDTLQKLQPGHDGYDVHTTLDADAQMIAREEAEQILQKFHPRGVSIVALEPATGDIRAMVSLPDYDANPYQGEPERRAPIPREALQERCASHLYEPGSTCKALAIAMALDKGIITPTSDFYCSGEYRLGRRTIHCAHGEVHHDVTPETILRYSCNIGAAQVGLRMGGKRLSEAYAQFGLFDPLNIHLPYEVRGSWSLDPHEQKYNPAKAARAAFGQSVATTPLHIALAYAAIANGGVLMKPRLITEVTDSSGHTVEAWQPRVARHVVSPQTAALVSRMLRSVVSAGTGRVVATPGYQIAGKTGTSSKYRRDAYIGSFVGYAPAGPNSTPRLVILVTVDEPDAQKAYYGADVAAPAFHAITSRLLKLWQIPEDDPTGEQARESQNSLRHQQGLPPLPPNPELQTSGLPTEGSSTAGSALHTSR